MDRRIEWRDKGGQAVEVYPETVRIGMGFDAPVLDLTLRVVLDEAETLAGLRAAAAGVNGLVCTGYDAEISWAVTGDWVRDFREILPTSSSLKISLEGFRLSAGRGPDWNGRDRKRREGKGEKR